jgi:hypothetical protein
MAVGWMYRMVSSGDSKAGDPESTLPSRWKPSREEAAALLTIATGWSQRVECVDFCTANYDFANSIAANRRPTSSHMHLRPLLKPKSVLSRSPIDHRRSSA